jgi:hypothetical protein
LSEGTLCRWLTVILAQRSLLTEREEEHCISSFFAGPENRGRDARLRAYADMKRRFAQPLGGRPSFPAYYARTVRGQIAADIAAENAGEPERWVDGSKVYYLLPSLRRKEPALHRAVLDRIRSGKVSTKDRRDGLSVSVEDLNQVDMERKHNAENRKPKAYPDRRADWIEALMAKRLTKASATRKVKRWINTLGLSADEVKASIARGRLVRLP